MKTIISILSVILAFLLRPPEMTGQVDTGWIRIYDGPYFTDVSNASCSDQAGAVYLTGYSAGAFHPDCLTLKYDSSGKLRWIRRYDGTGKREDEANDMAIDDSANLYITGYSYQYKYDMLTIKYDSDGNELRIIRYPGFWETRGSDIAVDPQRNIYLTGSHRDSYLTVKYSPDWSVIWEKEYYFQGGGVGSCKLLLSGDTGVIVSGTSVGDIATVRYDENGNLKWIHRFNGNGNAIDWVTGITAGPLPSVYATGTTSDSVNGHDFVAIKLIPAVNRHIKNLEVPYGVTRCFDAFETITLAGDGAFFIVQDQGSVTLVAGAGIFFLPGTVVEEGGYLSAYITADGQYCNALFNSYYSPMPGNNVTMAEEGQENDFFRIFPNPVRDDCTIQKVNSGELPAGTIEIRNITGQLVYDQFHPGQAELILSLGHLPAGIYIISYTSDRICKSTKIIRY